MSEQFYGTTPNPWPYEAVVCALQILALSPESRSSYLPTRIPSILYDGGSGCVVSDDPGTLTRAVLFDFLSPGRTLNEWIDDERLENAGLEPRFAELLSHVDSLDLLQNSPQRAACRAMACDLLAELRLYQADAQPLWTWQEIFGLDAPAS